MSLIALEDRRVVGRGVVSFVCRGQEGWQAGEIYWERLTLAQKLLWISFKFSLGRNT